MSRQSFATSSRADLARQQWQHECPELDASVMALFGRLIEANEMLNRLHLDPLDKAHDLRRGEFDVLATLRALRRTLRFVSNRALQIYDGLIWWYDQ